MGHSRRLRYRDLRSIYRLIGECRDLGDDSAVWRRHMVGGLCRLVGAEAGCGTELRGFWLGRPVTLQTVPVLAADDLEDSKELLIGQDLAKTPEFRAICRLGRRRLITRTRVELGVPDVGADEPGMAQVVCDSLSSLYTLREFPEPPPDQPRTVNAVLLNRAWMERPFDDRERLLVHWFHHEIGPLIGRYLAPAGSAGASEMPPRLQEVLECLLEGEGEKQAARKLGVTPATFHQYAKAVYRHFGIHSRAELMARWVRLARGKEYVGDGARGDS